MMSSTAAAEPIGLRLRRNWGRTLVPYVLIGPTVLIVLALMAWPIGLGAWLSLTDYRVGPWDKANFIGLENYLYILKLDEFWHAIQVTAQLLVMCVVAEMSLGLGMALILNRQIKGINIFRAACIIPLMIPNVVSATMWRMMMEPDGILNYVLSPLGFYDNLVGWFSSPDYVLWAFLLIDIWMMTPQVVILLLSGLQSIPQEVTEAATVDGADVLQRFRSITFPLLLPFFLISFMIRCIQLIQVFDVIYILSSGGPADASLTLHMAVYRQGFTAGYFGVGTAYSFILSFVVLVVVLLIARRYMAAQGMVYGES
jgi:ABC-type sugar transport system permease subunit